jgi:hypothetical protein
MIYDSLEILPLKNFLKILNTGDYKWLFSDPSEAKIDHETSTIWEMMLYEYGKLSPDSGIIQDLVLKCDLYGKYNQWVHIVVMLCYVRLDPLSEYSKRYIVDLNSNGYNIDGTSRETILETLPSSEQKVKNLINQIKIKQNMGKAMGKESKAFTYDEIVVWLQIGLAPTVINEENLTVMRYLHYKKSIYLKSKKK